MFLCCKECIKVLHRLVEPKFIMQYIELVFRKKVAQLTVLFWMFFRMLSFEIGIEKFCRHFFLKSNLVAKA